MGLAWAGGGGGATGSLSGSSWNTKFQTGRTGVRWAAPSAHHQMSLATGFTISMFPFVQAPPRCI